MATSTHIANIVVIGFGAAVGANLRYVVSIWAARQWGTAFPYGTLIINISGSFVIGLVLALAGSTTIGPRWRLLIVTGLLGGFTTFSAFSYETYDLISRGRWLAAGLYILASVGVSLLGVLLGAGLARAIA